ncbi:MAG TPA: MBL fold metallo-hydrolase [Opitutaceae bacterium]|nr:MBL fold metallo-hydrolase [Opitutaceae bacterium]
MPTRFPVSDHCDGWRFFNPRGRPQALPFTALPRWWFSTGRGARWPRRVENRRRPQLPAAVPAGQMAATFIGHATFLLQMAGTNILTDPIFSEKAGPFGLLGPRRVRPPALALGQLPPIDLVLVSHNHYDHLDLDTLRWLARARRPLFVGTLGNGRWLQKRGIPGVVELDWWQSHRISPALELVCTPAQHFAARAPWDRCRTLWAGFALRTAAAGKIYFCGDSGYGPHFAEIGERLGGCDLAFLPIGAYEPRWFMAPVHMNPEEAVRAHRDVRSRCSLGMHFGTFPLTDEAIDAPRQALAEARVVHGVTATEFDTPDFGETRFFTFGK